MFKLLYTYMVFFDRKMTSCIIVVLFVICANFTTSSANYYYIIPSLNVSCPQEPCLTLLQFATNISQYDGNNSNITLFFQPGNHSLAIELSVVNASNFSMIMKVQHDDTAFVRCTGQSGRFCIRDSTSVWIEGLHFIGCGGNEIIQVAYFILENITFLGITLDSLYNSLVLNRVGNARFVRCSFISNFITAAYGQGGVMYVEDSTVSIADSNFVNNSATYDGGVVSTRCSSFTITTSSFINNWAPYGGVIYAYESFFNISSGNFVNNSARHGGVMHIVQSTSFSTINTNFTNNSASECGGVYYASNSSFKIGFSIFIKNRAEENGGVIYVRVGSMFNIITSNFTNNTASIFGGVVFADNSSFSIGFSVFIKNRADDRGLLDFNIEEDGYTVTSTFARNSEPNMGGVIHVRHSKFDIVKSGFASNSASYRGGVVYTYQSSFTITTSNFTNNRAPKGGAIYTLTTLFKISSSNFINNSALYGGVIRIIQSSFDTQMASFMNNSASVLGGVICGYHSSFHIGSSIFIKNRADDKGGVICIFQSLFIINNNTFENNNADSGGVMYIFQSSLNTTDSKFSKNLAGNFGGVMQAQMSRVTVINSHFVENVATNFYGGVMYLFPKSTLFISTSSFTHSRAGNSGGVIYIKQSLFSLASSNFVENSASYHGGTIYIDKGFSSVVTGCSFIKNQASSGGVMFILESPFNITTTNFIENSAYYSGGVLLILESVSSNITSSKFIENSVASSFSDNKRVFPSVDNKDKHNDKQVPCLSGEVIARLIGSKSSQYGIHSGVITSNLSFFTITSCSFANNHAALGIVNTFQSTFIITNCTYANNSAFVGGAMSTFNSSFNISNSLFSNNHAVVGGVAATFGLSLSAIHSVSIPHDYRVSVTDSIFRNNVVDYGGIMFITGTTVDIVNGSFYQNSGSFYAFNCNITFRGITKFESCREPLSESTNKVSYQEGGAVTSCHSNVTFIGNSTLLHNQARDGGAILAIASEIIMLGVTIISNNAATKFKGRGGGIYLIQSDLTIQGSCNLIQNHALKGGGIHASHSPIVVHLLGDLTFTNNSAKHGGGAYLEVIPPSKFSRILSEGGLIKFVNNHADVHGGAVYIADIIFSFSWSFSIECFIQSVTINKLLSDGTYVSTNKSIIFFSNTAVYRGSNIFGGLFDRCTPTKAYYTDNIPFQYFGINYLQSISNITLDSISSYPVRVCFCDSIGQSDCSYEMPVIKVRKGMAFRVSVVAVDQTNGSVDACISTLLFNANSNMGVDEQQRKVQKNCTELIFHVCSVFKSETMMLSADSSCKRSEHSIARRNVSIQFLNCTCPVGFEPSPKYTKCECICDSRLSLYISNCDFVTMTLLKENTNSWITYINDTDPPDYIIHPVCPFDYCYPPSVTVSMNLNLPSGSDAQCAHNRSGILCGACQLNLSLSLGSSRCLPCPNHWPLVFISIILASLVAGILLITVVLVLNMTVADGMINAIIFYANVTAPFERIIHSSAAPSFPTVFVAWLNLDIGFDVCFVKGLDAYAKTWLQLLFPVYIISLVAMVIKISEYSPRFTRLISSRRRDPVATLATLVLLSYSKLLSTTISVLSFATLIYPDGSKSIVWLVEGNMQYFQGKHIVLVIIAALIVLIGVPYTFLLFSWQWLIQIPKVKFNRWIRLNSIITAYHAPYTNNHRYWSGLLLLVRLVLYITVAVTVSNSPQIPMLMTIVLVGGLLFVKGIIGTRLYKRSSVDIVETIILLNLLLFAAFSWYNFKADSRKETAIAYISTIIVFVILTGEIVYGVILSIGCTCKRKKTPGAADQDRHALLLAPLVCSCSSSDVTHSSVEISLPMTSPSDNESNDFESENDSSFVQETPIPSSCK